MQSVNVGYAKAHLSKLLERVAQGEEVMIARSGEPVAKLVGLKPAKRKPGRLKGRIRTAADFDAPLPPEIAAADDGEACTHGATAGRPYEPSGAR